jgi:transcriptional regulator of acetoin/glycerol metabolism
MSAPEMIDAVAGTDPQHCARPRPEIGESWRHCAAVGLRRDRFAPARDDGGTVLDGALLRAGQLVIERLGQDLHGSGVAAVLTNEQDCIIDRHADEMTCRRLDRLMLSPGFTWGLDEIGTNALGLATYLHAATTVHGPEHYMDALAQLTTVAAPVRDPSSGRMRGALGLVCSADVASNLLLPMARWGAREVEHRLADGGSAPESILNEALIRHRGPAGGALVPLGQPNRHTARNHRQGFGWESLTERELTLIQLVANGLTNREAAARLHVSRHTIDSHLRHIFQKLGINSRVQLARMAASTPGDPSAA